MAVWLPRYENTLIVELAVANLYDKGPYGGSVGGLYKVYATPQRPFRRVFAG